MVSETTEMRSNQATLQMFACMCCILSVLCDDIVLLVWYYSDTQRILFILTHFFFIFSLPGLTTPASHSLLAKSRCRKI